MCRLHPEAEVAKSAVRIGHQLLCGFGQHCSAAAVRLISSRLPRAQAGPQQQQESQKSASEQTKIGDSALAADAAVTASHAEMGVGNALAALHHTAAVRLLGEAAMQQPASLAAEVWDALWPCLGPAGKASAACICGMLMAAAGKILVKLCACTQDACEREAAEIGDQACSAKSALHCRAAPATSIPAHGSCTCASCQEPVAYFSWCP